MCFLEEVPEDLQGIIGCKAKMHSLKSSYDLKEQPVKGNKKTKKKNQITTLDHYSQSMVSLHRKTWGRTQKNTMKQI